MTAILNLQAIEHPGQDLLGPSPFKEAFGCSGIRRFQQIALLGILFIERESRDVAAYRIVPPGMDPARLAVERSVTMNDQNT